MKHIYIILVLIISAYFLLSCEDQKSKDPIVIKDIDTLTLEREVNNYPTFSTDKNYTDEKGLKQGSWITYNDNGGVYKIENFINDNLNGLTVILYNENNFTEINYKNGLKHGYEKIYRLSPDTLSKEPKSISYYINGEQQWLLFPSADIGPTLEFGFFVKGLHHVEVDSTYIIAPYNNGNTWFEGALLREGYRIIRVGIHKIYDISGNLKYSIDYTKESEIVTIKYSPKGDTLTIDRTGKRSLHNSSEQS